MREYGTPPSFLFCRETRWFFFWDGWGRVERVKTGAILLYQKGMSDRLKICTSSRLPLDSPPDFWENFWDFLKNVKNSCGSPYDFSFSRFSSKFAKNHMGYHMIFHIFQKISKIRGVSSGKRADVHTFSLSDIPFWCSNMAPVLYFLRLGPLRDDPKMTSPEGGRGLRDLKTVTCGDVGGVVAEIF